MTEINNENKDTVIPIMEEVMKMLTKMQQDASFYDASLEQHTQEIQAFVKKYTA
jgi:hypothetical protein